MQLFFVYRRLRLAATCYSRKEKVKNPEVKEVFGSMEKGFIAQVFGLGFPTAFGMKLIFVPKSFDLCVEGNFFLF